ncbi:MAG: MopE-related protein [Polyangiales bacterium]
MPPFHPRSASRVAAPQTLVLILGFALVAAACGELGCPSEFTDVSGVCVPSKVDEDPMQEPMPEPDPPAERCDGIDNDGDDLIDEPWPSLGNPCGDGLDVGECIAGVWVCKADESGIECQGSVGPTAEICDGKDNDCDGIEDNGGDEVCDGEDNDCDGLIDEGVLVVIKEDVFAGIGSVAAIEGGFVVTRIFNEQLRVETYDREGNRTGHRDDLDIENVGGFLDSDGAEREVWIAWGDRRYTAASVIVDANLIPVITDSRDLHPAWDQVTILPTSIPPFHPRVSASSKRLVGYATPSQFAIAEFGDGLASVASEPTLVSDFPAITAFETANAWVVREAGDTLRGAVVLDDGRLLFDIDIGRGEAPSVAESVEALGVASVLNGDAQLTELNGLSLQCISGKFCNETLSEAVLGEAASGPTALAYEASRDLWFMALGAQIAVVGREDGRATVQQIVSRADLAEAVNRVDIVEREGTVAIMQTDEIRDSALTFLGCL